MEDKQIVERILAGETELYSLIVKEYQQIVANLTYKLCGNKLEVEEVTQQVFVELYMALPRFRFDSKLSSFIYRITVNVVCKMMNKAKRFVSSDEYDDRPETPSDERNAEQKLIHQEQLQQLRTAIGHLKDEQRTALVLYTFEDFSYNQIAEVMQCSLSKVESLIFRAKKNLAKELKQ
ncbi:MAG: sigma-70 family RNA polymerase sigma factor [Bacteroidales bacterium]|nr:sigma-70 family RNA polymerase sigma factor [Bacteroidales bacterium]